MKEKVVLTVLAFLFIVFSVVFNHSFFKSQTSTDYSRYMRLTFSCFVAGEKHIPKRELFEEVKKISLPKEVEALCEDAYSCGTSQNATCYYEKISENLE